MSGQQFPPGHETFSFACGAVGYYQRRPRGFDCLGPYAKVANCRIHDTNLRRTVYATWYPSELNTVPAACVVRGQRMSGFLVIRDADDGRRVEFVPHTDPAASGSNAEPE